MTEELINKLAKVVKGKNNTQDILIFTLSTCMWCKKCKSYLNEHDIQYRYIDVDLISYDQKKLIMDFLSDKYTNRISYPFLICDEEFAIGYDLNKYDQIIKTGGN